MEKLSSIAWKLVGSSFVTCWVKSYLSVSPRSISCSAGVLITVGPILPTTVLFWSLVRETDMLLSEVFILVKFNVPELAVGFFTVNENAPLESVVLLIGAALPTNSSTAAALIGSPTWSRYNPSTSTNTSGSASTTLSPHPAKPSDTAATVVNATLERYPLILDNKGFETPSSTELIAIFFSNLLMSTTSHLEM